MKIQARLLLLMLSKTVFTMSIALLITSHLTREALETAAQEKLTAVMEARYSALTRLTASLQAQMTVLATAPMTVNALHDFSSAFHNLGNQAQILLQQQYLAAGSAYRNAALPPALAEYDAIHKRVTAYFSRRQSVYEWEDMFMVDTLGNVMFSLKKENDFATNLRRGAWHDSGLARAVLPLLDNPIPEQLSFADYSQYAPSRMRAASFMAMPVFDEEKQQFLGVIAIQLPIEKVNELTMDKSGLGDTGEVIIVGKDGWMLSNSRFSKDSTILKLQIKTKVSAMVLAGKSGILIAPDYRGVDIMAAVKPFTPFPSALGDSKALWGVITKIEHREILHSYENLQNALLLTSGGVILLAMGLALWGGRSVSVPLTRITDALTCLAGGEQVDIPELHRHDEIGAIAKAAETFHSMAQQIEYEHWLSENVTILTSVISNENRIEKAAEQVLQLVCHLLDVPVGAIYLLALDCYQRVSSQGLARTNQSESCFQFGVGVLGQCAKNKQPMVLSPVPDGIIIISSGLAEFPPHELVIYPIEHKGEVLALVELAATVSLTTKQHTFLKAAASALGLHFANLQAAEHNANLLAETRQQAIELRASSGYARSLIEASLDPLVTIGIDGKIMDVNAATEKVTGIGREYLIGSDFCDYFTEPDQARKGYQQAFSKGFVTDYPLAIRHNDGRSITDVLYNASVYRNSDGQVAGLFAAARDITDKKRAEEKMRQQQAALLQSNADMQLITEEMKSQNEELKTNQEELRAQQEEALKKNRLLEVQSNQLKEIIAEAKLKADELEKANHYKSEFLANMSHELRTPLNSILILSKNLAENAEATLLPDQIESAAVISESGTQLLTLINDILDLSKIEAGKLELVKESFALQDIATYLRRVFLPQSAKKSLDFVIEFAGELPEHIYSDRQRLTQILSNLLTNAIKFTDSGTVKVLFRRIHDDLNIDVIDSGIGIPPDKLDAIFGAFQQLDGSTSRKYGGSGLGLAISRNLAQLLGGEIKVSSQVGRGSCFSLRLAEVFTAQNPTPHVNIVTHSQASTMGGNILIVEDDKRLLALVSRMISSLGFSTLTAESAEHALLKIHDTALTGIFLDLGLPKMSGMALLRHLKADSMTASIPIFIMSGTVDTGEAHALGALGFLQKPVTRDRIIEALKTMVQLSQHSPRQSILLIEDSRIDQDFVKNVLRDIPADIVAVDTGNAGLQLLENQHYAAVILDLQLPDIDGFEWLKHAQTHLNPPPIIVYSARELTEREVFELKGITESIVTKNALSDRLREEVLRILQGNDCPTPVPSVQTNGKKLLLVDDDARNLYALAKALKSKGFGVEVAPDSLTALDRLAEQSFDVLLTDIMMPQIDGYELIRRIRALGYDQLPIIAITAKAMMGDDSLCLEAGASAYLAKPVDVDALIELLNRF